MNIKLFPPRVSDTYEVINYIEKMISCSNETAYETVKKAVFGTLYSIFFFSVMTGMLFWEEKPTFFLKEIPGWLHSILLFIFMMLMIYNILTYNRLKKYLDLFVEDKSLNNIKNKY